MKEFTHLFMNMKIYCLKVNAKYLILYLDPGYKRNGAGFKGRFPF